MYHYIISFFQFLGCVTLDMRELAEWIRKIFTKAKEACDAVMKKVDEMHAKAKEKVQRAKDKVEQWKACT